LVAPHFRRVDPQTAAGIVDLRPHSGSVAVGHSDDNPRQLAKKNASPGGLAPKKERY